MGSATQIQLINIGALGNQNKTLFVSGHDRPAFKIDRTARYVGKLLQFLLIHVFDDDEFFFRSKNHNAGGEGAAVRVDRVEDAKIDRTRLLDHIEEHFEVAEHAVYVHLAVFAYRYQILHAGPAHADRGRLVLQLKAFDHRS